LKERLPLDQRIEFEVSFWTVRDEIRNNKEFLDAIDGKTPEQLIEQGKELFMKRKAAGAKDYEQFANWDQMIAQYTQERIDQNRKKTPDERDKKNPHSVTYKLNPM
jgi:AICAR transformylase/IMP cyclohydrolase PurH